MKNFLVPAQNQLDTLNDIEAEITSERLSWQSSRAAQELVEAFGMALDDAGVRHYLNDPKQRNVTIERTQYEMFGNLDYDSRAINVVIKELKKHLSVPGQKALRDFEDRANEHRQAFREAVQPLSQQRRELSTGLTSCWQEFMSTSPDSLSAFVEFLSADDYVKLREANRPFLSALQGRSPAIVDSASRQLLDRMLQEPKLDVVREFIDANFVLAGKDSAIRDWLMLLSQPAGTIDPVEIAERIVRARMVPGDLKQPYTNYLFRHINPLTGQIKNLLGEYRTVEPKLSLGYSHKFARGTGLTKHGSMRTAQPSIQYKSSGQVEKADQPEYEMVVIKKGEPIPLTGDLRESYITDTANQFNPNDRVMRDDIQKIIDSLRDDPYGLGVRKLTDFTIPSLLNGQRPISLRRYRADQRPGVDLSLSEAKRLRTVFHFDPKAYPGAIFLDEILDHGEFDNKYTS